MIIKKKNFNLTPRCGGKWPFTVPEVAVMMMTVRINPDNPDSEKLSAFAVIHNFGAFALSGILESYGFDKLESAGIWATDTYERNKIIYGDSTIKKSLTPFFEYLERRVKAGRKSHEEGAE